MGRLDLRPARVHQASKMLLAARRLRHQPSWFQAMSDYPPGESLIRTLPVRHEEAHDHGGFSKPAASSPHASNSRGSRRLKKASKLFVPLQMRYEEDALRTDFFSDHPWELARPRTMLEDDGKDYQRWDWSKPHQHGRPVNGESVVQRQMHLQRVDGLSKKKAYDVARKEHYELRHEAEVERRVALEEASAVDARFGATANDIGMQLESKVFEQWKVWAEARVVAADYARSASYGGGGSGGGSSISSDAGEDENTQSGEGDIASEADTGAAA